MNRYQKAKKKSKIQALEEQNKFLQEKNIKWADYCRDIKKGALDVTRSVDAIIKQIMLEQNLTEMVISIPDIADEHELKCDKEDNKLKFTLK